MIITGIISSQPAHTDNRIKFTLRRDDTRQEIRCLTELDFGQFAPLNQGDHVVLTGAMADEKSTGHEDCFVAVGINPMRAAGNQFASRH